MVCFVFNLFSCISPFVFTRLQLYDLVELKILGDGNCQVCSMIVYDYIIIHNGF